MLSISRSELVGLLGAFNFQQSHKFYLIICKRSEISVWEETCKVPFSVKNPIPSVLGHICINSGTQYRGGRPSSECMDTSTIDWGQLFIPDLYSSSCKFRFQLICHN